MDDFAPGGRLRLLDLARRERRTTGRCRRWATPSAGFYRKDWFENPEIMAEFKEKTGRDLAVPTTWDELMEVAKFFQGREIDGKTVYGAAIFTERGSEGITMGATSALYSYGFKYETEPGHYEMDGAVNSPECRAGARVLQGALRVLHAAGLHRQLHGQGLDAFKIRPGRDDDELVRLLARHVQGRERRRRQDRLLRQPRPERAASTLGGQGISVVANTDNMDGALAYIKWFAQPEVQKKWWSLGGYAVHNAVLNDPSFVDSQPFAADFLDGDDQSAGLLAGAGLRDPACRRCRSGCTTMSSPTRARRRRRSTR